MKNKGRVKGGGSPEIEGKKERRLEIMIDRDIRREKMGDNRRIEDKRKI